MIEQLANKKKLDGFELPKFENNSRVLIEGVINNINTENEKLKTLSIEDVLKPLEKELINLKNEKKIYDFRPKLARFFARKEMIY